MTLYPGGKGGNQAVAAARLGASVNMIGCLGDDSNATMYRDILVNEGVQTDHIFTADKTPTGIAFIEVIPSGENRIVVNQGANDSLSVDMVAQCENCISKSDIFLTQLENPIETIMQGLRIAKKHHRTVILDPAPAKPLPKEIFSLCDYLTPNETELEIISEMSINSIDAAVIAAKTLLTKGAKAVINKRGSAGTLLITNDVVKMFPGFSVNAIDTTAAGDSFNAGLGIALAKKMPLEEAIVFANAVGALSTTKEGSQGAMPTLTAVNDFLSFQQKGAV